MVGRNSGVPMVWVVGVYRVVGADAMADVTLRPASLIEKAWLLMRSFFGV